ncbi:MULTISPECIES: hypothetical protein [unclassified Bradyrhizobium]|uniref:hypothetical protein n=1 Tax=unclassified Bradyrhizobium TaxID=2631580 RepID=UPI0024E07CF6|nr:MULTISPECIES: hypothetical protein [unclassified Bradyrhizobium]
MTHTIATRYSQCRTTMLCTATNAAIDELLVMTGLVPGIHVHLQRFKTWMAGTSPAMTA